MKFTGKSSTLDTIKAAYRLMRSTDPELAEKLKRSNWKLLDHTSPFAETHAWFQRMSGMDPETTEALGATHTHRRFMPCRLANCPGPHTLIYPAAIKRWADKWALSMDKATAMVLAHEHLHSTGVAHELPCIAASVKTVMTWPKGPERERALEACIESAAHVDDQGGWERD